MLERSIARLRSLSQLPLSEALLRPMTWRLWKLPPAAAAWVLLGHALAATWAALALADDVVTQSDLNRFAAVLVCATCHLAWTRESEERRRGVSRPAEYVDQTSIWIFTAGAVLPVPLALSILAVIRVQRYLIARKPATKFLFTTSAIGLSMLGVHTISVSSALQGYLTGDLPWPGEAGAIATMLASLVLAVAWYFLAQALLIGTVRALTDPEARWRLAELIGDWTVHRFVLTTLLGAVCAAVVQSASTWLLLLLVPLSIASTRDRQRLQQAAAERESLRVDAFTDYLTGLPRRNGFEPLAELTLHADQERDQPTAVLMIDIDHFRVLNDTLGHLGADQVLTAVASTLRSTTRHGDLLCRYGGEEIAVMLPKTGYDDAVDTAELIRSTIASMRTAVTKPAGGQTLTLGRDVPACTVSIGVAVSPDDGASLAHLQQRADEALIQAKYEGRNRVLCACRGHRAPVEQRRIQAPSTVAAADPGEE